MVDKIDFTCKYRLVSWPINWCTSTNIYHDISPARPSGVTSTNFAHVEKNLLCPAVLHLLQKSLMLPPPFVTMVIVCSGSPPHMELSRAPSACFDCPWLGVNTFCAGLHDFWRGTHFPYMLLLSFYSLTNFDLKTSWCVILLLHLSSFAAFSLTFWHIVYPPHCYIHCETQTISHHPPTAVSGWKH